VYMRGLST